MTPNRKTLGNPFLETLGVTLHSWREGYAEFHLPVRPMLGNGTGRVQGGVLCTLLDVAAAYCGLYSPEGAPSRMCVSLALTTNFLDSTVGELLIAKGRVQRAGRSIFFSQAEVFM